VGNSPTNATDPSGLLSINPLDFTTFGMVSPILDGLGVDTSAIRSRFNIHFNAGEGQGESAQQYWAKRFIDDCRPWYDRAGSFVAGSFASLWTNDTSDGTFTTLITALGVAKPAAKLNIQTIRNSLGSLQGKGLSPKTITYTSQLPAGNGLTNKFGNMKVSSLGSKTERLQAYLHESVHSKLSPHKNAPFANLRANIAEGLYNRSQLLRYTEEALAETSAQLGSRHLTGLNARGAIAEGLRFPFNPSYQITPAGLATEIFGTGLVIGGGLYGVHYLRNQPSK
jgi:hypothetical protein